MTPKMEFECLLVSSDPAVYRTMSKVLRNLSISLEHCLRSSQACDMVAKGTHELVVIDWEGEGSSQILRTIWNLPRKRKPTMVALSSKDGSVPGVHITLPKPVTLESGTRSLRTAYSYMLVDHRRNARHAIMVPVIAVNEKHRPVLLRVTDIGAGGVGLSSSAKLTVGDVLSFLLLLSDANRPIQIKARVVWTREYGTAGCEFLGIEPVDLDILCDWLKAKTQVKKPLISV